MFAADFREVARDALEGKWKIAIIACLVAALLGAVSSSGPEVKLNINGGDANVGVNLGNWQIFSTDGGLNGFLIGGAIYIVLVAIVMAAVLCILGSIVGVGYAKFNLDLVDQRKEPEIGTLFNYFPQWKTAAKAGLMQWLYVFAWSLLFIIPGIIAGYSYAMTRYILAERPELTAQEALEHSRTMMTGNRWRLFCLQLSFIGWDILAALTLGIGNLWLNPYKQAATAAFYRDVCSMAYPTQTIPCEENTCLE
jgi:uncharacterized membrane protein